MCTVDDTSDDDAAAWLAEAAKEEEEVRMGECVTDGPKLMFALPALEELVDDPAEEVDESEPEPEGEGDSQIGLGLKPWTGLAVDPRPETEPPAPKPVSDRLAASVGEFVAEECLPAPRRVATRERPAARECGCSSAKAKREGRSS